jgi:hypothetical protein
MTVRHHRLGQSLRFTAGASGFLNFNPSLRAVGRLRIMDILK